MTEALQPFDRTPPFSLEAEVAVLGALLMNRGEVMAKVLGVVRESDFYRESHRRIFRACVRLFERGHPIDVLLLSESLTDTGELDAAGGPEYLSRLIDAVPTSANVEHHARVVRERSYVRAVIEASTNTIRAAYDLGEGGVAGLTAELQRSVLALENVATSDFHAVKDSIWQTFEDIESAQKAAGGVTGVPSGFHDLDRMLAGFQPGDLVVVAARPSVGKTAFALDVVRNAAIGHAVPCGIVSLEMSQRQLTQRLLAAEGRVDMQKLRRGGLSGDEHQRLAAAAGHVNSAPIYIDDHPAANLTEMCAKIERLWVREHIGLAVIDYLQLIRVMGNDDRRHQIDEITRTLKALAGRLDIPIMLLSQLSRAPETRTNHQPMLSDLRESGGIEQDADVVLFLYRPEMYLTGSSAKEVAERESMEGIAELIVGKQRNGPTGPISLYFKKEYTRFDSVARNRGEPS